MVIATILIKGLMDDSNGTKPVGTIVIEKIVSVLVWKLRLWLMVAHDMYMPPPSQCSGLGPPDN